MGHIDSNFLCTSPVVAPNTASCTTSQLHSRVPLQEMGFVENKQRLSWTSINHFCLLPLGKVAEVSMQRRLFTKHSNEISDWEAWRSQPSTHEQWSLHPRCLLSWYKLAKNHKDPALAFEATNLYHGMSRFWAKATLSCIHLRAISDHFSSQWISLHQSPTECKTWIWGKNGESGHAARYLIRNPPLELVANSH